MAQGEEIDFGDNVEQATFDQVLEMDDDDEEREFSKSIIYGFFEQAEGTFRKMDEAMYVAPYQTQFRDLLENIHFPLSSAD